jgi:hypothetical protein
MSGSLDQAKNAVGEIGRIKAGFSGHSDRLARHLVERLGVDWTCAFRAIQK